LKKWRTQLNGSTVGKVKLDIRSTGWNYERYSDITNHINRTSVESQSSLVISEEPDEGNLHVRLWGDWQVTADSTRNWIQKSLAEKDQPSFFEPVISLWYELTAH